MHEFKKSIAIEIEEIFAKNEIEDLKKFINKRKYLNISNMYLIYLYHIMQAAGILITSFATSYNNKQLIWIGIGLNIISGIINTFEHVNNSISEKILKDIKLIKENKYIDEGLLIDLSKDNKSIDNNNLIKNNLIDNKLIDNKQLQVIISNDI